MAFLQTVHENFDEEDMRTLKQAKGTMTWHEFMIEAAKIMIAQKQ